MERGLLIFIFISFFISCKKEKTLPEPIVEDSNGIDFSCIGEPIGKFGVGVFDIERTNYKTVIIGKQEWMAENLKVSKYNDGTVITNVVETKEWLNQTQAALCSFNNDINNDTKFGKLYNWYTVNQGMNGNKNICPVGWHVPTSEEWDILTDNLGGVDLAGGKMKEIGTNNWKTPNKEGVNKSLFTALPGGFRSVNGVFTDLGENGFWWSTTEYSPGIAWFRNLNYEVDDLIVDYYGVEGGFSIRCLKD